MGNLLDYFDATYLINLPERTDRKKAAIAQFNRIEWPVGSIGVEIFPALKPEERCGFPSVSVRGCFLSHLRCLELAYCKGCRNVLVMEDDVALSSSLRRLTPQLVALLKRTPWDFVFLGHYQTGDIGQANSSTKELSLSKAPNNIAGTHFYGVNSRAIPMLVDHLEKVSKGPQGDRKIGPMPVDGAFNIFRQENPDIAAYIVLPKLGWQRPSKSDITPSSFDRVPWLRPALDTYRELKDRAMRWQNK